MSARISSHCSLNSGARLDGRRFAGELHRGGHELELGTVRGGGLSEIAVRLDLGIGGQLEAVLGEGPLSLEGGEALPPHAEGRGAEDLRQDVARRSCVGGELLVRIEPLVGDEVLASEDPARAGPVLVALQAREGEELAVLGLVRADERVGGAAPPPRARARAATACSAAATARWPGSSPTSRRRAARRPPSTPHPCARGGRARPGSRRRSSCRRWSRRTPGPAGRHR